MTLIALSVAPWLVLSLSAGSEATGNAAPEPPPEPPQYPAENLHDDHYTPGPGWNLVWADEFDGDELDPLNWNRQVERAGRFNEEWQRYTDSTDNAYVDNGCLVLQAHHVGDDHGMGHYTSARLNTARKHAWTYGKIAARIQLPYGNGIWPAFWMLGANVDENGGDTPWPQAGEIDILELYGSRDPGVVEGTLHFADRHGRKGRTGPTGYHLDHGRFADAFHVFDIEWNEREIVWSVDGQRFATADITSPDHAAFHRDFFILLNIAVGGRPAGEPDDSTPFPVKMAVDWVRVYQRD